ncbi:MAG: hypothetical protein JXA81_10975 [Sedimentisphaerales bacterium]|nr:hypothetical protein [Sedimentisphaerales bacterium]
MEIHETISKWHEETQEGIEGKIGPDVCNADEIDKLCLCVIRTSYQYCTVALQLLNDGFEYPAKALMRCLGELNIKFTWSLVGCKNDKNNTSEKVKRRLQRWRKSGCSKGIQLLKEYETVMRPEDKQKHEETLHGLKQHYEELEKANVKNLPDLKNIFEQLGDFFYEKIRPNFYSAFNDAVHLDPASMSAIFASLPQGRDVLQMYCIGFAYNITSLIRLRYELDTQQIKEEYDQLMKMI